MSKNTKVTLTFYLSDRQEKELQKHNTVTFPFVHMLTARVTKEGVVINES